jgi:phospholipid/cholesterol/gamma-HCH transport system substrate-binding protein
MQKRAPTLGNLLVIALFALSCFGLLLFLWESFGGSVPLKPKSYRFKIPFERTLALAEQSDVRISGVNVGHVINFKVGKDGRTHATIEIDSKYAPIRSNMHAILRQKTLLGETYVQLTPGPGSAPALKDEGELAKGQVEPSVTLDDILSTFDPQTRKAFQVWMQSLSEGFKGKGEQINQSFAQIQSFVESSNKLTGLLAPQEGALRALIHNTGVVFDALTEREGQYRGLIANGERAFHAAAEGSQAWATAFRELPAFERNSKTALRSLDSFAVDASPALDEARPWERQLTPLLNATKPFAPRFDAFLTSLGPFTKAALKGFPAVKKFTNLTVPLLAATSPLLHNLNPFFEYLSLYTPEAEALFANATAADQVAERNKNNPTGPRQHELRVMNVLSPESLAVYTQRLGTNRANAYPLPGAFNELASGLSVFSSANCANSAPSVSGPPRETITQGIIEQLYGEHIVNKPESSTNEVPAPPCKQQPPFNFNGQTSQFPHAAPFK